ADERTLHKKPDTADAQNATPTIRNFGMTKATTHGANNAVKIGSIFDTFSEHTAEAATYASYLEVTEDMRRIINFNFRDEDIGMQHILDGVFGISETKDGEGKPRDRHPGIEYWNKLYEDINGGMKAKDGNSPFDRFFRGAKIAAVSANLRVVIQQPTAYLRAGSEIGYHYLAEGMTHAARGWKRALKYAPIAQQKDWGRADIGTGHATKELLFGADGAIAKIQDKAMFLASAADAFAWGSIWTACEFEVKHKNKGLKEGSNEFYYAVAERFTEIVNKTQVVDGVLQRSQNMRNQNALVKMGTMFMSEPTKQYNMLASAVYDFARAESKEARAKAGRKLARTGISLTLSGVMNAAAQSIIDALRDDEKEKTYWEKWFSAFLGLPEEGEDTTLKKIKAIAGGNLESAANPFGYFPFAKDVWSLLQGYDVERTDVEGIADFMKAAIAAIASITGEGPKTRKAALNELLAAGATLFGIPYASFKRDIGAIARSTIVGLDNLVLEYRMEKLTKNIKSESNADIYYDILFRAKETDKEAYDIIYADMLKSGLEKEVIDEKISKHTNAKFDSALSAAKKAKDKKDATIADRLYTDTSTGKRI
ncbi:MAG: hypothetical protein IJN97_05005, partial [Oscillospiraceae bacterium]|nr:hypothetical protein [Oscillospiraceae bacterium]